MKSSNLMFEATGGCHECLHRSSEKMISSLHFLQKLEG